MQHGSVANTTSMLTFLQSAARNAMKPNEYLVRAVDDLSHMVRFDRGIGMRFLDVLGFCGWSQFDLEYSDWIC